MPAPAWPACRDCAQSAFGGPGENRFTAYDALCRGNACRDAGYPQVFVNSANLTLFVRVTDLAFGGPAPGLTLEHSYNMDETGSGVLGKGWSFSLGDTITLDTNDTLVLRRGSGRTDRFTTATGTNALFPVTSTTDTLERTAGGGYILRGATQITRAFNAAGKLISIQDGATVRVALEYDSSGRLTVARYRGRSIAFTTDSTGRITSIKDDVGRTIGFAYNGDGRLSQQTNADGRTAAYEYDAQGNLKSIAWAGGKTTIAYTGDSGSLSVAGITTPDGALRQYDTPRRPGEIRITDSNGDATFYSSTASGLLLSVTDAAGIVTSSYAYDAAGNRVRAVNGAGEATTFAYDSKGNLTGITDGANNRWTATYTTAGLASVTDPNKNIWTLTYDDSGNLAGITDPRTFTVVATRNTAGQIVALADPKGNARNYTYNADGLITGFADPLGKKWTYEYDGAARTSLKTDAAGLATRIEYTTDNRIANLFPGDTRVHYDYSGVQRDSSNRIAKYTDSNGNQLTYTYDAAGQLTGITMPGDKTVSYQYDRSHRLSRVSDWQGNLALYRYDIAGYPVSVSVSGGPVTIYQYDGARNLRAIVSTGPDGTPVAGYRYGLDANGNRTSVSALEPNTSSIKTSSLTYAFDAANRPVSRSDGATYRYDANGHLIAIEGPAATSLTYDPVGRLQGLSGAASGIYAYDSMGLRTMRNDRRMVYDISGEQPRVVMETDTSNAPVAWYVYGLGLLWKVAADGTPYFYHFDGDGNTVAVSNPTRGVVNTYRYDATGRLAASAEAVDNPFRARGESGWMDDGNGLLFDGRDYQLPELRLTLPGTAEISAPGSDLKPQLAGVGACFLEPISACLPASGRRTR